MKEKLKLLLLIIIYIVFFVGFIAMPIAVIYISYCNMHSGTYATEVCME